MAEETFRKLATIQRINSIDPIPGADAIMVATVGGWKIVVRKDEFVAGELVIMAEIDSWIPTALAPFLSKGKEPRVFGGVPGERLRTVKLRGQLSQGLLLPLSAVTDSLEFAAYEGRDLSDFLGIQKWERPIPAHLAGSAKGSFPSAIPKTDQERCQNLGAEIASATESKLAFEVTEKLDGSSMTCYWMNGEFGVCSRNIDLMRDVNNTFWQAATELDLESKIGIYTDLAIQGELVGPGIQGNLYNLTKHEFHVFDVYDIAKQEYMNPEVRKSFVESLGLKHVPIVAYSAELMDTLGLNDIEGMLKFAEGKSQLNPKQEREGIVFKQVNGGISFKAISNGFLLGSKE